MDTYWSHKEIHFTIFHPHIIDLHLHVFAVSIMQPLKNSLANKGCLHSCGIFYPYKLNIPTGIINTYILRAVTPWFLFTLACVCIKNHAIIVFFFFNQMWVVYTVAEYSTYWLLDFSSWIIGYDMKKKKLSKITQSCAMFSAQFTIPTYYKTHVYLS